MHICCKTLVGLHGWMSCNKFVGCCGTTCPPLGSCGLHIKWVQNCFTASDIPTVMRVAAATGWDFHKFFDDTQDHLTYVWLASESMQKCLHTFSVGMLVAAEGKTFVQIGTVQSIPPNPTERSSITVQWMRQQKAPHKSRWLRFLSHQQM